MKKKNFSEYFILIFNKPFFFITQARYAFNQGLAGLVIYSIDTDDFLPECSNVRYPLLRAISIPNSKPIPNINKVTKSD